ncbi:hypothetical protein FRB94_010113 [Tulasnella sp. JGI-2019a]|nr:hypothetical protein FRB94_010113 [Tulasnella sp. JGI-2019a]KAG9026288.1 hypothetical protein FRB95_009024 [Tulasnella sp. JGI-2019a]
MAEPHLALYISELLLAILEHLSVDELMVASLVCKAWSAPAVETRWRIKTIRLSRLLANLAPIKRHYHYVALTPKTPITQDHWSRFLERCANRVTILEVDVEVDINSLALISTLLQTFGGQLCSDLHSLTWPTYNTYDTKNQQKLFDLLTVTKLRALELRADLAKTTSLSQLAHRALQIQEIVAPCQSNSFDFSVFSQLRSLSHCGCLSTSDYRNLACCPHLRVLRLRGTQTQVTSIQKSSGETITFLRLEEFLINPSDDAVDHMILRSIMPALRSLEYQRRTSGTYTIPLLNGIIRTSPCLESIILMANVPSSQLEWFQHDGVQRLFFHNRYKPRSEPDAGDLDLSTIARTFPKLKKLEVIWSRCRWHWSTIQMLGDRLPDLRHLNVSMDVSISSLSEAPKVTAPITSLTSLSFKVLCIQPAAIDPFISYLAILCPNIRNMSVEYFLELVEAEGGKMARVYGYDRAFVKRFFDYKGCGRFEI